MPQLLPLYLDELGALLLRDLLAKERDRLRALRRSAQDAADRTAFVFYGRAAHQLGMVKMELDGQLRQLGAPTAELWEDLRAQVKQAWWTMPRNGRNAPIYDAEVDERCRLREISKSAGRKRGRRKLSNQHTGTL